MASCHLPISQITITQSKSHVANQLSQYVVDDAVVELPYCTNAEAQSACPAYSSYSKLASIHCYIFSFAINYIQFMHRDLFEATNICKLLDNDSFIGLNDIQTEGIYTYDGETPFDYMFSSLRIHHTDKDCVHLSLKNNYASSIDTLCDGVESVKYAVWQMPSEIFDQTERTKINGNWDTFSEQGKTDTSGNSIFVLANKLWCNEPLELIIDYRFYSTLRENTPSCYSSGTIYNSLTQTRCEYYYIFIQRLSNTKSSLLSIHLTPDTNIFNIYLNNLLYITYTNQLHCDELKHNGYSSYIGKTEDAFKKC